MILSNEQILKKQELEASIVRITTKLAELDVDQNKLFLKYKEIASLIDDLNSKEYLNNYLDISNSFFNIQCFLDKMISAYSNTKREAEKIIMKLSDD